MVMELLFLTQVFFYFSGALVGFVFKRNEDAANRSTHGFSILANLTGIINSCLVLSGKQFFTITVPSSLSFGPAQFKIDYLSALLLLVISFLGFISSIFALGYCREYKGKKSIPLLGFFYNVFILNMVLVVTVQNAFWFLMVWELMSLASYFLVVFEHEKPEALKAGTLYLVMTHIGTAFITAAFLVLFVHSGSFSFQSFSANANTLPLHLKNTVFICALVGFGIKAGMLPFHIWLPEAHPQAPSHVSALMSGVMIKVAVFMLIRFLFSFLGGVCQWWGITIVILGVFSALFGILYALMETDLKRTLAFSSIENIGIIFLGLGMSIVFLASNQMSYASFALIAVLFHLVNHTVFKGLLFLGAGSVVSGTHTRNMEALGGLIKKMPVTAFCFLMGSIAISGLPPLNGFISEWLIFVSLLLGLESQSVVVRFFSPVLASLLGLTGALAATCFVKVFGISFLGVPRSGHVAKAHEASNSMKIAMTALVVSLFALVLFSPWLVSLFGNITKDILGATLDIKFFRGAAFLKSPFGGSQFSPAVLIAIVFVFLIVLGIWLRVAMRKKSVRISATWDCGMPSLSPRMQYSSTGFSQPLRRILSFLYQPSRRVELEDEGHVILRTAQHFEYGITHFVDELIYRPMARLISELSHKAKRIQTGHIQLYLSYIFITLILLLLFAGRS